MKQDLTCFLSGGPAPMRWLLLESLTYIEKIIALYPNARLVVVTEIEEAGLSPGKTALCGKFF